MWSPKAKVLEIGLTAGKLMLAESGAWWAFKKPVCTTRSFVQGDDMASWRPAISALAEVLSAPGGNRSKVNIVLSGRFVRWQLLPSRPELTRSSEINAYSALRFAEIFGKVAAEWNVLSSIQPPGHAMPACAIDRALLEAITQTCHDAGASLVSVTPYFSSAFDHWRKVVSDRSGWFGVIESDCLTLGLVHEGHWIGLRSQRFDADWREALPGMMAQIGISTDLIEPSTPLYLVGPGPKPVPVAGLPFHWLHTTAATQHATGESRMSFGI